MKGVWQNIYGDLNFICDNCCSGNHEDCIERNSDKIYPDCDCAHKRIGDA